MRPRSTRADIVARPLIVMRNDYQDALSAGLAVCEYAPGGKSAEEIRALWQWTNARLGNVVAACDEPIIEELVESPAITSGNGCADTDSIRQRQLPESASPALNTSTSASEGSNPDHQPRLDCFATASGAASFPASPRHLSASV